MDDLYKPIDFSAISGYPHVILEKTIKNLPCFQSNNIVDARRHVKKVSLCFNKWCCNALYEDVEVRTYNELIDAFMEKWKKDSLNINTVNSDVKKDASPDSNQKFKEIIQAMEFIYAKQLKAMKTRLAEVEGCIKYSDPIEPELHSKQEKEFHLEILEEPIDELLTSHEETKDFEFEMIEWPNNSNPHPPLEEPISSEKIFDNYDERETISKAEVLTIPIPISHPSEESIIDNGRVEDNSVYQCQIIMSSGWASTMTVQCRDSSKLYKACQTSMFG
jgi:hypothetical protein